MSVNLRFLYDDIVQELGQGVGQSKLNAAFPRATNRALSELESKARTGTDFALVDSIDDTVSQLEAKHEYILYSGIMYWLQRMGYANGDPRIAAAVLSDTERLWRDAKGDYTTSKIDDAMEAGDEDIIGLGYVGS